MKAPLNNANIVSPLSPLNYFIVTFLIMAATIMQTIDTTIANVALPRMQGSVSATQDEIAWVLTSYVVAAAIMTPLTGWLAGRFGRRRVFLASIAIFTITSALCGIAESLTQIVIFRILQGLSGAALIPLSQAILFDINPPENHGKAMAMWGVGVTLGPIIGPLAGGWLTDYYNWRWVFFINVPIGIVAYVGLLFTMPETKKIKDGAFDFFGFFTLAVGLGAMQIMLDRGERQDWFGSPEIIIETIIMGLGYYLFLMHTLTYSKKTFVTPAMFKDRNFVAANIFMFIVGLVLYATLALLPPLLQDLMNYPVFTTGLVTAPRGVGSLLAMVVLGKLINKFDARLFIAIGLGMTAFSLWQMTWIDALMDANIIIVSGLIQGFGVALCFVPLSTLAFSTLPAEMRNEGTAFFNLMRNIGISVGISAVEAMLVQFTQVQHSYLGENVTPYSLNKPAAVLNNVDVSTPSGVAALNQMITDQASMLAYITDFQIMMVLTILVMPLVFMLRIPKYKIATPQVGVAD